MGWMRKYSAANPAYRIRPSLRFVFSHPAHALALFFGAGVMRPGPGTWGTAAGVLVWAALVQWLDWRALMALILVTFVAGVWASEKTGRDLGVQDAGCIVIDEVVAVWLVCLCFPQTPLCWALSFAAFRVFDIVKLPPAAWIDNHMHSGLGVMLDDLLAAVWAVAAILALDWAAVRFFGSAASIAGIFG